MMRWRAVNQHAFSFFEPVFYFPAELFIYPLYTAFFISFKN